jgi:hypothetical protein
MASGVFELSGGGGEGLELVPLKVTISSHFTKKLLYMEMGQRFYIIFTWSYGLISRDLFTSIFQQSSGSLDNAVNYSLAHAFEL